MKIAQCSGCHTQLLKLMVMQDGVKKEIYAHPDMIYGFCEYLQDGIKVTTEVTDSLLMKKFQELVVFVDDDTPSTSKVAESNKDMSILSRRLINGEISISQFETIKKLTE